jgi:hypothetical protein
MSEEKRQQDKKQLKPINTGDIPEFVYQPPEVSHILKESLPDITILILFNFVFFAGAFLVFLRYDLR